jgi:cytochrome b6-f complex iron-sulfur subunit
MSDANMLDRSAARQADVVPTATRIAGQDARSAQEDTGNQALAAPSDGAQISSAGSVTTAAGLISRRQFCAGACQVASCAALATVVTGCADGQTSPSTPASMLPSLAGRFSVSVVQVNASGTALANVGGAALVESTAGLFLLARTSGTGFTAVDAVCTHEGCTVNGAAGDIYVCPCHGSRYDRNGQVVNGPARASLRQYATTFADDVVTIRL